MNSVVELYLKRALIKMPFFLCHFYPPYANILDFKPYVWYYGVVNLIFDSRDDKNDRFFK